MFCEKVENYQFSDDFSELAAKGAMKIDEAGTLRLLVQDLDPQIFQEIQNSSSDWERLEEGRKAYEAHVEFKKQR